ncbi:hypothetical protein ACV0NZ_001706 [Campylobacter jejuni]
MADLEQVTSDLNSASQSLQELREKYDGALDLLDNKNTEITGILESAKSNALQEVQTASNTATSQISQLKDTSLNAVNEAKNTATSQISQLKDTSLNAVNEAKNTATSEISSKKEEALGEFSQATSEFNSIKEETLSQIEQAKTEQGEKITALEQAKTEQENKISELEENNSIQNENIEELQIFKENVNTTLSKKSTLLDLIITLRVGEGETYATLEDALNEAARYKSLYTNAPKINIILKSGYILTKGLLFDNGYYANVSISSEDEEVIYDAAETCFKVRNFAVAPIVNTIFKDKRKTNRAYLIESGNGIVNQNKGFKEFHSGIAVSCGYFYGYKSIMQGCQNNVLYVQKGTILADQIDIQNFDRAASIIKHNIYAGYCGFISANNCNMSNSKNLCVNINGGYCKASNITSDKLQNCTWDRGDPFLNVYGHSVIDALGSLKSNQISGIQTYSNIAINTLTTNGIILN